VEEQAQQTKAVCFLLFICLAYLTLDNDSGGGGGRYLHPIEKKSVLKKISKYTEYWYWK
jgi:hypothetical protein